MSIKTAEQIQAVVSRHLANIVKDLGGTGNCQVVVIYAAPAMIGGVEQTAISAQAEADPGRAEVMLDLVRGQFRQISARRN